MVEQFLQAFSPYSIAAAVVSGVLMGGAYSLMVGLFIPKGQLRPTPLNVRGVVVATAVIGAAVGVAFYLGQGLAVALTEDQTWPRVLGRGTVFVVYIVAFALALGVRLHQTKEG